jgi:hypothetical protein
MMMENMRAEDRKATNRSVFLASFSQIDIFFLRVLFPGLKKEKTGIRDSKK